MLEQLLDSRVTLAAAIGLLSAINHLLARRALTERSRQNFVVYGNRGVPGPGEPTAFERARLVRPLIMTAVVMVFTLIADRFSRELVSGGWLVTQIASLGGTAADVFAFHALRQPGAADGRILYSVRYGQQVAAARSVGMAIVAAAFGVLFSSWAFAMAALLMLATGVGWYRRGSQGHS